MAVSTLPTKLPNLSAREAIMDALYRGVIGLDIADRALFDSAFAPDAVLDINGTKLHGLEEIHSGCYNIIANLDTTHFITNVRVLVEGNGVEASMNATALAQHYRHGQGTEPGAPHLLTGSLYRLKLVKDGEELWKATYFSMRSVWTEGDRMIAAGR